MNIHKILCKLGLHYWSNVENINHYDYTSICEEHCIIPGCKTKRVHIRHHFDDSGFVSNTYTYKLK